MALLDELFDALQASHYSQGQKKAWEWLFATGLPAALLAGSGVTIDFDEDAHTLTINSSGGTTGTAIYLELDGGEVTETYDDTIDGGLLASRPIVTYDAGVID